MAGYDPKEFEDSWYARWTEAGAFSPIDEKAGEATFSMVIPPPNVTGSLHMGHALNNTLQDILTRYRRMCGDAALWVPGTDHAGIATQNVVERQLAADDTDRHELGREAFIERTWKWKAESGGTITGQLRRLGVSCDWSRERFTMDEGLSGAVRQVFVRLYRDGLIFKDKRLVNWDPTLGTAISDLEVVPTETQGNFWHFRYPVEGDEGRFITVATTRPETMLGDTGVAVQPEDPRYRELIGRNAILPIVGRPIRIVGDEHADPEQGSGAVKITPAHDFNDFEVGRRQNLEMINILNPDGTLNDEVPEEWRGLDRFEARKRVVAEMDRLGLLEKVEDRVVTVPKGDRSGDIIEPFLTEQWYVDAETMAGPAIEAVESGRTRFVPKNWEKTYFEWMRNIRPWCISRQIWWGHQIPAWYGPDEKVFVAHDEEEAAALALEHYGEAPELTRDTDVLDTWFSSALWPFSTLGWPDNTADLKRFYPTSTLVTGFDIIFFWVARMMMMGLHFRDEVPFRDVYIHALVRDEHGQKMSKSKGNVIDPLDVIDEFGADAFRFTLAAFAAMGRDVRLSNDRIAGYRNFINKVWNASRFAAMKREGEDVSCVMPDKLELLPNRWIRSRLNAAIAETRAALDEYRFNDVAHRIYQFTWHEFCDWYVEISKVLLDGDEAARSETLAVLTSVFEHVLRLLHPVSPFVTEELWQQLPAEGRAGGMVIGASYPEATTAWEDAAADADSEVLLETVRAVRNIRSEMGIAPRVELDLVIDEGSEVARVVAENEALVKRLAKVNDLRYGGDRPQGAALAVVGGAELAVPVAEHVDLGEEANRLRKEIAKLDKELKQLRGKLGNASFVERAPAEVVAKNRARLSATEEEHEKLSASLSRVESIRADAGGAGD